MNEYLILKKQASDGCDYTIGCGKIYKFQESDLDLEEFVKKEVLFEVYPEAKSYDDLEMITMYEVDEDRKLSEMIIVELSTGKKNVVDMEATYSFFEKINKDFKIEMQRLKDEADFETLKKKLNK